MEDIKQKYIKKLDEILLKLDTNFYDEEYSHKDADDLIIEMLKEMGFNEFADKFDKMSKWYAGEGKKDE